MENSRLVGTPDATALLRSKMHDSRRNRADSMSRASTSSPLYVKGEVVSPYHARTNQDRIRDGTNAVNSYELAALRNEVQVMARQREEDARQRAEDSHIIRDIQEEVFKLREQLNHQPGTPVEAPRQLSEEQVQEGPRHPAIHLPALGGLERYWMTEQTRVRASALAPLPASQHINQPALVRADGLISSSRVDVPTFGQTPTIAATRIKLASPTPSSTQLHHQHQPTGLPNSEQGRAGKTRKRSGPPKNIARINQVKAASANRKLREQWMESEVDILVDIINELKKHTENYPAYRLIVPEYNRRLHGVVQRAGEKTCSGTILTEDRQAPVRTVGGISAMMKRHGLQACQQNGNLQGSSSAKFFGKRAVAGSSSRGSMATRGDQMADY
ncbi:hypothetical protein VTL71DRAFT_7933 [Oculimacula yallundae]|uniref:Uncharacterized protein n=1 Tax=Oculimacula yallundae TaxID=86028 RepID=A0ABR4CW99_9HELO